MATFEKCGEDVRELVHEILCAYETHKPLLDARVAIDLVFAYGVEKQGAIVTPALSLHGVRALGIAKKMGLKERVMGRGDCEISIDGDWWGKAGAEERRALLDHELHHFEVDWHPKRGATRDDAGRPVLNIRKHDYQFGWFKIVAERNGIHSLERQQARLMWEESGQSFWPALVK